MSEAMYLLGQQSVWCEILRMTIKNLPEADQEKFRLERLETIAWLRIYCEDYGDNDWPDELHLTDIINKHLLDRLIYTSMNVNAIVAEKDREIKSLDDQLTAMLAVDRAKDARIEFLEKAFEELQADDERNYQSTRNWDYLDAHLPTYAAYLRERDSRPPSGGVQSGVQEGGEDAETA